MDHVAFGKKLKILREANGFSLESLDKASGVAKNTIHNLELGKGNPTIKTLEALATSLGETILSLLDDGDPISVEDLGRAVKGIIAARRVRRAYVLFFATRDRSYLERLTPKERRALESLDLTGPLS